MHLLESSSEFKPRDRFSSSPVKVEVIPPLRGRAMQLMLSKRDLLLISALKQVQFLLYGVQPITSFNRISGARESKRPHAKKLCQLVLGRCMVVSLVLLVLELLHHQIHQLCLLGQDLSKRGILCIVVIVVVVGAIPVAASEHHLT